MELLKLWEILYRRKKLYITVLSIIMITVILTIIIYKPLYKSAVKIHLKPINIIPEYFTNLPSNLGKFQYIDKDKVIDTYKSMMKLDTINNKVLRTLNIKNRSGEQIHVSDFVNPSIITLLINGKGIKIIQENDTEIFTILGISKDAYEAMNIANSFKKSFIKFYDDLNRNEAIYVVKTIEKQINDTKSKLNSLDEEKYKYDKKMGITDLSTQRSNYLSRIVSLEKERTENLKVIEENKKNLVLLKDTISRQPEFNKSSMTDEMKKQYQQQLFSLELGLARAKVDFTSDHPEVRTIQDQIDVVKEKFNKEVKDMFGSETYSRNSYYDELIQKYSNAEINKVLYDIRAKILSQQINEMNKKIDEFISYNLNSTRLHREIENQSTVYGTLIKQLEIAKIAANINYSTSQIIQDAEFLGNNLQKYIYFPKRIPIILIAFIIGNILSLSLVFFREYLDNTIRNMTDLEATINAPIIESISMKDKYNNEKPFWNILSYMSLLKEGIPRAFSLISTYNGNNKSIIAIMLAKKIAEKGYKTLLVDFNFIEPSIANLLGISPVKGINDWLTTECNLKDIVFPTDIKNLDIIPSFPFKGESLKFINFEKIDNMLETLKRNYDIIIFETAPIIDSLDTMILTTAVKKVIFLCYQERTPLDLTIKYISWLNKNNIEILGTIFISN